MKIVSENRFSGKTYFYTISPVHQHGEEQAGHAGEGERAGFAAQVRGDRSGEEAEAAGQGRYPVLK